MTRILVTGSPTSARLAKIMDAAIERLGLTEIAVLASDPCDPLAVEWNDRRFNLYRFYREPVGVDVHLIFDGYSGREWGAKIIRC